VNALHLHIEYEQEEDGRWLAEVRELAGVLAYGDAPDAAMAKVQALALRTLAEQIEHGEQRPQPIQFTLPTHEPVAYRTILAKPTHRKEIGIEEILTKTGIRATVIHKDGYSIVKPIKTAKK
jgi:predicted RNase H-like HicB family nuclease